MARLYRARGAGRVFPRQRLIKPIDLTKPIINSINEVENGC
jgi:hypothetical protein